MHNFSVFFFVLMMIHIIYPMDKKQNDGELTISLVDYRSCRESRYGRTEEGPRNGVLKINPSSNRDLWQKLCDGSNYIEHRIYCKQFDPKWLIKRDDITNLMSMYNSASEEIQKKMKLIPIRTEIATTTIVEKIRDRLLHYTPLSLGILVPNLIIQHAEGIREIIGATVLGGVGLFVVGEYVYPTLDSYNSGVGKLSEWFGKENRKRVKMGQDFVSGAAIVYIYTQFFLKIVPKCSRIVAFICNEILCSISVSTVSKILHVLIYLWQFSSFMSVADDYEYKEPFERSNKKNTYYTLGDLIDYQNSQKPVS